MSYSERTKLAEELIDLRELSPGPPEERLAHLPKELAERAFAPTRILRQEMIGLYAEHYTKQQLLAELEFYRSDVGQSILVSQRAIRSEMPERMNHAMQEHNKRTNDSDAAVGGALLRSIGSFGGPDSGNNHDS